MNACESVHSKGINQISNWVELLDIAMFKLRCKNKNETKQNYIKIGERPIKAVRFVMS